MGRGQPPSTMARCFIISCGTRWHRKERNLDNKCGTVGRERKHTSQRLALMRKPILVVGKLARTHRASLHKAETAMSLKGNCSRRSGILSRRRHLAWNPLEALCEPKACGSGIYLFAPTPTTPMVRTMDPKLRSNATLHGHGHRYYHVSLAALQGHQHGKGHVQC